MGGGFAVLVGQTYPNGQNQQPGALSPQPFTESVENTGTPYIPEPGQPPSIGTPIGPNVLADDVTFITGPIPAPDNTNSTVPPAIPSARPTPVMAPLQTAGVALTRAYQLLGQLTPPGYAMDARQASRGLIVLNSVLQSMQSFGPNVFRQTLTSLTVSAGVATVPVPGDVVGIIEARWVVSTVPLYERVLGRFQWVDYQSLPTKNAPGPPTLFMFDYQQDYTQLYVWPVPTISGADQLLDHAQRGSGDDRPHHRDRPSPRMDARPRLPAGRRPGRRPGHGRTRRGDRRAHQGPRRAVERQAFGHGSPVLCFPSTLGQTE